MKTPISITQNHLTKLSVVLYVLGIKSPLDIIYMGRISIQAYLDRIYMKRERRAIEEREAILQLRNPPPSHKRGIMYLYLVLCRLDVLKANETLPVEVRMNYLVRHKISRIDKGYINE